MTNDWKNAPRMAAQDRWAGEITPLIPAASTTAQSGALAVDDGLHMGTGLPDEVVTSPTTMSEVYLSSLKSLLNKNTGNYVVAAFLIGTQNLVSWEGILYDVGSDFITIYQEGRDRYIVCDIYSLKFIEFYDTRSQQPRNQSGQGSAR